MDVTQNMISILQEIVNKGNVDVEKWNELSQEELELIKELQANGLVEEALNFAESLDSEENWELLKEKLFPKRKSVVIDWRAFYKYAAIFIGLISLAYLFQDQFFKQPEIIVPTDAIQLVLENGDVQILNPNGESKIVQKKGKVVVSQKGKEISYKLDNSIDKLVYNQIKIPYGKTFNVTLSDGTMVYLNAGSSLKYPVKFIKGKKRIVILEGEAFFDVAKDKKHPFVVKTSGVDVRVLGTKFNVTSYKEDAEINTVLVEGSVSLYNDAQPSQKSILTPGHKGSWDKNKLNIEIEKVDTKIYTEWMSGDLIFRKSSFNEILKKLERTYNVKIINNNPDLFNKKFNASFNKNIETIDDVMNAMSKIQSFTFKKETNIITIN